MAHANEALLRDAYAAFGRGDMDGYWSACHEDFAFNVPGKHSLAGRYQGKARFLELVEGVMRISGGAFEEKVVDVLANDVHGVVLAEHRFTREGKPKEYRTAHVYNIRAGKLQECWEQPEDPIAFDDAWG
jgi:ketosteroid isomerase-like protein